MKRPVVVTGALVAVVLIVGLAAAYVYFFSSLRTAPKPLALASSTPAAANTSVSSTGLAGSWTATSGSQAGYRVGEVFAGQSSSHEAVARTSSVTGGFTLEQTATGYRATSLKFTANLSELQSVDQVAGRDVAQRDRIVSRSLSVSQFPDATFVAQAVDIPAAITGGTAQTLSVPGQLTIHGVTRPVTLTVEVKVSGSQGQAAGSTTFTMTDFGIDPPQVPITVVQPQVKMEFQLALVKA